MIYKERPSVKLNCTDKQLVVTGVSYFDKYKQEAAVTTDEPSIHSNVIKTILNIDPEQVRLCYVHNLTDVSL